jgi:hypothetical protein
MSVITLEGIVEKGVVHLPTNVQVPDRTKV